MFEGVCEVFARCVNSLLQDEGKLAAAHWIVATVPEPYWYWLAHSITTWDWV